MAEDKKKFFKKSEDKTEEGKETIVEESLEDKVEEVKVEEEPVVETEVKPKQPAKQSKPKKEERMIMLPTGKFDEWGNPSFKAFTQSKVKEQLKKLFI